MMTEQNINEEMEHCEWCKWFEPNREPTALGFCVRFPRWERVSAGHYCGEWTPTDEEDTE